MLLQGPLTVARFVVIHLSMALEADQQSFAMPTTMHKKLVVNHAADGCEQRGGSCGSGVTVQDLGLSGPVKLLKRLAHKKQIIKR